MWEKLFAILQKISNRFYCSILQNRNSFTCPLMLPAWLTYHPQIWSVFNNVSGKISIWSNCIFSFKDKCFLLVFVLYFDCEPLHIRYFTWFNSFFFHFSKWLPIFYAAKLHKKKNEWMNQSDWIHFKGGTSGFVHIVSRLGKSWIDIENALCMSTKSYPLAFINRKIISTKPKEHNFLWQRKNCNISTKQAQNTELYTLFLRRVHQYVHMVSVFFG